MQPERYETNEPVAHVVDFLEKANKNGLASDVIDAYAEVSTQPEQFNLIAKLHFDIRNIPKAIEYGNKVLSLTPTSEGKCAARQNLAKMYNNINKPKESLFYTNLNILVDPEEVDYQLEKLFSLYLLNMKPEAEIIIRQLLERSDLTDRARNTCIFNLGTYDLEAGEFIKGLRGFLIGGKNVGIWPASPNLPYKFWNGGAYPGKTLILFVDGGGIGDEMLQIRFMTELKELGFNPIYYTHRQDLCDIFNRCGFPSTTSLDNVPEDSLWTYYMQVPIYLNSDPDKLLAGKYLYPSKASAAKWTYIKEDKKLRIGIRWQGNAKNERDLHRRVPLDAMMKMLHDTFDMREVSLYSLQIGDGIEEKDKYPEIIDLSPGIYSYDDTLAILENMDYVITSCTSVLHASAIVGTKTLALIPISAYFTWVSPPTEGRDINTSIWYGDNLRIFKQVTPMSWEEPIEELQNWLSEDVSYKYRS